MTKRLFDLVWACFGLVILSPIFFGIAVALKFESPGPVFFRQERVGLNGRLFRIHKFRTMIQNAEKLGPQLTVDGDDRITRVGTVLRKYKLDELAQLFDVLSGEMSFVGPRPEVPKYVCLYPEDVRRLALSVRPGITDLASIAFRNEQVLLAQSVDPERTYIEEILPAKIAYCLDYVRNRSIWLDIKIIFRTLRVVVS